MDKFPYKISGRALWSWRQRVMQQAAVVDVDIAEVDWLLQGLCQVDGLSLRLGVVATQVEVLSRVCLTDLEQLWDTRVRDRVPIQHLVGETPWRRFMLHVSPAVLIPRPETELIIDHVVAAVEQSPEPDHLRRGAWVDLGTGSGAIALGLADALPEATILAVDISSEALAIAKANALGNGLGDRIQFLQGSWLEPLEPWRGQLVGVVSNPPYIPSAIVPTLQPEVANHEPHLALDGGQDGLTCIRHLIQTAPEFLKPYGFWLVELMAGQAPTVAKLLAENEYYADIQAVSDLAGIERFVIARRHRK
ncbi:MAG: peptide chain release factor N(5)-glutamine methyltransferase [Cyanobacteria bacterium J06559_3]